MKTTLPFLFCFACLTAAFTARAEDYGDITAISSLANDDYVRTKLPNGSYAPESYAFGEGGLWNGRMGDPSIDNLRFIEIARTIAGPLASRSYVPARDPNTTKLLIMVYWGTTIGTDDASSSIGYQNASAAVQNLANAKGAVQAARAARSSGMNGMLAGAIGQAAQSEMELAMEEIGLENDIRDKQDLDNARILGYNRTGMFQTDYGRGLEGTALRYRRRDLIAEVEDDRYFVVLMAYDFQLMWKQKKHKLLWETRYSIRQYHNEFDKVLAGMTQYASQYFGKDSQGLIRQRLPVGNVDIGEPKVIEVEPAR